MGPDASAPPTPPKIGVYILDDHQLVRDGLRHVLDAETDMTVVGEAATAVEALDAIPACQPDVAVLDVRLPDGNGIEVCREVRSRCPEVACLMLTATSACPRRSPTAQRLRGHEARRKRCWRPG